MVMGYSVSNKPMLLQVPKSHFRIASYFAFLIIGKYELAISQSKFVQSRFRALADLSDDSKHCAAKDNLILEILSRPCAQSTKIDTC